MNGLLAARDYSRPLLGNKIARCCVIYIGGTADDRFLSGGRSLHDRTRYFDEILWPHLRTAYKFARWLVRNDHDAEDVLQESFVKAFRALESFRGGDSRVWLLTIVRN